MEMMKTYLSTGGTPSPSDEEFYEWEEAEDIGEKQVMDYSIGREFFNCAFVWPVADEACEAVKNLAEKYGVGFLMSMN